MDKTLEVDFTHFETEWDERRDSTNYGGFVMIGDKRIDGTGTDRELNFWNTVETAILEFFGINEDEDLSENLWRLDSDPKIRVLKFVDGKVVIPDI